MRKSQRNLIFLLVLFMAAGLGGLPARAQTNDPRGGAKTASKGSRRGAKHSSKGQQRGVAAVDSPSSADVSVGPYYALLIGNNNYRYVNKLQTAIGDADAVARVLHDQLGFITRVVHDATRDQMFDAFTDYRHKLRENSNLLIYYAGHGILDRAADEAYWLPVDASSDNPEHWISANDITSAVRAIASKHILIISDSCYSGALMRSVEPPINPQETADYIKKMLASKSRNLMSSGGVEPVYDGGPDGHSIFASTLLQSLHAMDDPQFTAADVFQKFIKRGVAGRSKQVPEYSFIRNSGDEFGDFVFTRTSAKLPGEREKPETIIARPEPDVAVPSAVDSKTVLKTGGPTDTLVGLDDSKAVNEILRRYEEAYRMRDADALWKIWPSSAKKTRDSIGAAFKIASSIRMDLTLGAPEIAADGQSATVKGQFSQLFTPKDGRPQPRSGDITFLLKKANGVWMIVDIK